MAVVKQLGAGSIIKLCDAANPMSAHSGSSDANLDDVSANLPGFTITMAMGTVDVTTLDVATLSAFFRDYIAELRTATVSTNFLDDKTGAFIRRIDAIASGVGHTAHGRGAVDFQILVGGDVTGNLQVDGTLIVTQSDVNIQVAAAVGGPFNGQVCGQPVLSVQS